MPAGQPYYPGQAPGHAHPQYYQQPPNQPPQYPPQQQAQPQAPMVASSGPSGRMAAQPSEQEASQYGQDMPDQFETILEPALIPVHLQYNQFARNDLPLKNPDRESAAKAEAAEDTLVPQILTKGIFRRALEAPSHVVLNHANCWTESSPTLAPDFDKKAAELGDDSRSNLEGANHEER